MTTKTTLSTIVAAIKSKEELPTLLEIKHYAKILKKNKEFEKVSYALNALSKALGYRKFNDLKDKLEDSGTIINFRFEVNEKATLEMPYSLILNCEAFINDTYENIYASLEMQPWVIISEDGVKIQYKEDLVLDLLHLDLEYTPQKGVFWNEHEVVEFKESMIPLSLGDLHKTLEKDYEARIKEEIDAEFDKDENGSFLKHMSNLVLIKPLSKIRYAGGIVISDYINKDLTIDMDITFGNFNTDIEAGIYANDASAVFKNNGENSKIEITSKGKTWAISDESIVFKRLKEEKAKIMGRPLNPSISEDFKIMKESLNEDSLYHEMYTIDGNNDLEIIDYSLAELSKHLKDGFDFQVLAYFDEEIKQKKDLKYNTFSESEIFFNGIKEIFDNEKSLGKYTFEELADDIYENKDNHSKILNFTFRDKEKVLYERLIELVDKKFNAIYKYNVKLVPIDSHDYISVVFEYCECKNEGSTQDTNNRFVRVDGLFVYKCKTDRKDKKGIEIRFADRVKDSKGNTYLVDKYKDTVDYFLSCNEDLNIVYELNDFKGELEILNVKTLTRQAHFVKICHELIEIIKKNDINNFSIFIHENDINDLVIGNWTLGIVQALCKTTDAFFKQVFEDLKDFILNAEYIEAFIDEVTELEKAKVLFNYLDDESKFKVDFICNALVSNNIEIVLFLLENYSKDFFQRLILKKLSHEGDNVKYLKTLEFLYQRGIIGLELFLLYKFMSRF